MSKQVLYKIHLSVFFSCFFAIITTFSQTDSTKNDTTRKFIPVDSLSKVATPISNKAKIDSVLKYHSPKKAALRSAILPGLGQIYNKKYWKLPIVYGALGITAGVFIYNVKQYKDLRFAYKAKYEATPTAAIPHPDSTNYRNIRADLVVLDVQALRSFRDEFRRNVDYSVLYFLIFWGLNVVDATVDAHLKTFDVSPDLSFHMRFGHSQMAGTNGVSLVLAFK